MMLGHKRACNSHTAGGSCNCGGVAWKLVPLEPSMEMIVAGAQRIPQSERHTSPAAEAERIWRSMVVEAPQLDAKVYSVKNGVIVRDGVEMPLAEIARLLNEHQLLVQALFEPLLRREGRG